MKWFSYTIAATAVAALLMLLPAAGWSMGGSGGMMGGMAGAGSGMMGGGSNMGGQMPNQGSWQNPSGMGTAVNRMMNGIEHFLGQGPAAHRGNSSSGTAMNGGSTGMQHARHAWNNGNHAGKSRQPERTTGAQRRGTGGEQK